MRRTDWWVGKNTTAVLNNLCIFPPPKMGVFVRDNDDDDDDVILVLPFLL